MDQFKRGEDTVERVSGNFTQKFYKLHDGKAYKRSEIVRMEN